MRPTSERFARGEPITVEVGNIERALADLWKQASQAGEPRAEAAVSRSTLWNVVIPTRGRESLAATKQTVDEMAPALPTRAIILCLDDTDKRTGLEATIESNVVSHPGGARTVYSEEITLIGPRGAESHFGALVRALQTPGVPTATFWLDTALPQSLLLRELLPATNRLVLDTTTPLRPEQLFDLDRLAGRARHVPLADLGWLRLGNLRSLFASLFDPPVGGGPLQQATRLTVRHRTGRDASALLVVAWLGVLLGWRPLRSAQVSDGGLRFDFDRGDKPARATLSGPPAVEAFLVPADGPCGKSGVLSIEIGSGRDRYSARRSAMDQAILESPIAPAKPVKLDPTGDAELCVSALGPRGRDPLFSRCLGYACRLWSIEPETSRSRR
jgi:glucose-6-phosphate dehydrogenase assembly protein OpcA